jgi:hypothetical protein
METTALEGALPFAAETPSLDMAAFLVERSI